MDLAVVIPAYKCKGQILRVINTIPEGVKYIILVDDFCPEKTGEFVQAHVNDPRLSIIFNEKNLGVGGAVLNGYRKAFDLGADVFIKLDGDGQMDPEFIPVLVEPILLGDADYTKGNRFTKIEDLLQMPKVRLVGNLGLSFLNKISSGYWKIMDPTNGYTALHRSVFAQLPLLKISKRYFFETDLLFRLGLIRACVQDVSMSAKYADEKSNLKVSRALFEFGAKHIKNFIKRVIYRYFMLDFNLGSIQLLGGVFLFPFGILFGFEHWLKAHTEGVLTPTGTIMISVLTIILGFQLLLAWLSFDVQSEPDHVIHSRQRK